LICTTGIANSFIQFADIKKDKSVQFSAGLTFAIGVSKEIWDGQKKNNHFSWKDLSANVIGIIVGVILMQIE
jgi:uncharacterized protein YfiM (DUF2279 family)